MKTKIIEVTQAFEGGFNHGKFLIGRFDTELERKDMGGFPLIAPRWGWGGPKDHILLLDIETGEGALFRPGGYAPADLDKHRIWVCPMFLATMEVLYKMDLSDLDALPDFLEIESEPAMSGYRRPGPEYTRPVTFFPNEVAALAPVLDFLLEWASKRTHGQPAELDNLAMLRHLRTKVDVEGLTRS